MTYLCCYVFNKLIKNNLGYGIKIIIDISQKESS